MKKNNPVTSQELINELLEDFTPNQWISFLFDVQASLIRNGNFGDMTDLGLVQFTDKICVLKNFFVDLNEEL